MKKKLLILSVLAICIATLTVGTLAFFTSEGKAHNVITSGSVEIEVLEWADEDKTEPFEDLTGIMPGTTVTKIVEIKNIGKSDAWVRVKIDKAIELEGEGTPDNDMVELNLNTTDWEPGSDGYFYYKEALQPGELTEPIFTTVTFNASMGNEYQSSTATVDITAQAVQCANNGNSAVTANGWPAP